jgi:hypothetical protein
MDAVFSAMGHEARDDFTETGTPAAAVDLIFGRC